MNEESSLARNTAAVAISVDLFYLAYSLLDGMVHLLLFLILLRLFVRRGLRAARSGWNVGGRRYNGLASGCRHCLAAIPPHPEGPIMPVQHALLQR